MVCFWGITEMGLKIASRVRGLSDAEFREAFGTEEQCRAALARGFRLAGLRPSWSLLAVSPSGLSVQPLQEADIADGRHDLPLDQAAADGGVCSHPSDRDGEERHLVGGVGTPARGETADGLDHEAIARGAKRWPAPDAKVVTDGLACWAALDHAGHDHRATRTDPGRKAARMASFEWANTTLGNIKSAITGTCRKLGPDHTERYFASFAWRYNRRHQLQTMIPRFLHSAARTQPIPYPDLIAG